MVGVLALRLGGSVSIPAIELDGNDGDRVDFSVSPAGCSVKVTRKLIIVGGD